METVALINAVITLVQFLEPKIEQAIKDGQITPEEQQKLLDQLARLRDKTAFAGAHWQPRPAA